MRTFVFAWYPHLPAPCEGNDPLSQIRAISMRLRSEERVERAIGTLERRLGGHVILWE